MTRDDIIRLALEAGFDVNDHGEWVGDKDGKCLERFAAFVAAVKPTDEDCSSVAALVAAAEREACAKEADLVAREFHNGMATFIAAVIRARGESK
jgi:hypothetical protein